jgi:hypothetical protein
MQATSCRASRPDEPASSWGPPQTRRDGCRVALLSPALVGICSALQLHLYRQSSIARPRRAPYYRIIHTRIDRHTTSPQPWFALRAPSEVHMVTCLDPPWTTPTPFQPPSVPHANDRASAPTFQPLVLRVFSSTSTTVTSFVNPVFALTSHVYDEPRSRQITTC